MSILRSAVFTFSIGLLAVGPCIVSSQSYPSRPVRVITSAAGGTSDLMSRLIAAGISGPLGQQVIVENRVGIIAVEAVAKAPPDGYSLLVYGSLIWTEPLMRDNVPWDPVKDFSPVTQVAGSPNILAVHPSLPVKSVKDLINLARTRPGALNYATTGAGASSHLAAELFKSMTGTKIENVRYKGAAAALSALVSGEVQIMFATTGAVMQHINSGRLRGLAVTSPNPSALFPGLPTVAASGLPGYDIDNGYAILVPAKTPAAIITHLNQEIVRFLNIPETKERFLNSGLEAVGSSPEQLAATIKSDMAKLGKVIRDAGIRPD